MPVVAIGHCGKKAIGRIRWLVEEIWIDENGDAELIVEGVIEVAPIATVEAVHIFFPYLISNPLDETDNCSKHEFVNGYTECWPGIYSQYQLIKQKGQSRVIINGISASIFHVQPRLIIGEKKCSEIEISFDPPIKGDSRVFRVAMQTKKLAEYSIRILPKARKEMILYSYGITPFGGTALHSLLRERGIKRQNIYNIDTHHIQINFWGLNQHTECSKTPYQTLTFSACTNSQRYCPPIKRQAKRIGVPESALRERSNSYLHWVEKDAGSGDGDEIRVIFSESKLQRWLYLNWLPLLGLGLSIIALVISIIVFLN